jgi:hypothetical protein
MTTTEMTADASSQVGEPDDTLRSVQDWLLEDRHPAIRRLELLRLDGGSRPDEAEAVERRLAVDDPWIPVLLGGARRAGRKGRDGVHPYTKWSGSHWRLISLAELGVTLGTPAAKEPVTTAFDEIVRWLLTPARVRRASRKVEGLSRICGSQDGAAIWAACRLGFGADDRVRLLVENLLEWQWPDGGWNCDKRPEARHASFSESLMPLRGLAAYSRVARCDDDVLHGAVARAAEFFLRHNVVESERTGEVANPRLTLLRWPPYWHYDVLQGLVGLIEAGYGEDRRLTRAKERLVALRSDDGTWQPSGRWWRAPGRTGAGVELVDWGPEGEAKLLTLRALRVLRVA